MAGEIVYPPGCIVGPHNGVLIPYGLITFIDCDLYGWSRRDDAGPMFSIKTDRECMPMKWRPGDPVLGSGWRR